MHTLFIKASKLADICRIGVTAVMKQESTSVWYRMIKQSEEVFYYKYKQEELTIEEKKAFEVLKANDIKLVDKTSEYEDILADNSKILRHPNAIYVLDVEEKYVHRIEDEYGVVCVSIENVDSGFQDYHLDKDLHLFVTEGEQKHKWSDLKKIAEKIPTNSLLIIDRYLFAKDVLKDGVANIEHILNSLLPDRHKENFEVTIMFDSKDLDSKHNIMFLYGKNYNSSYNYSKEEVFKKLSERIHKVTEKFHREKDYSIDLHLLSLCDTSGTTRVGSYKRTHNRRILSNYYIIRAEHKLGAFRNGNEEGTCSQCIDMEPLFSYYSDKNAKSDMAIDVMKRLWQDLYPILQEVKERSYWLYSKNGNVNVSVKNTNIRFFND